MSLDELTSSPCIVEPYPVRQRDPTLLDSPAQRRIEGVYDRFLMASTGVKRVGKGYQSEVSGPLQTKAISNIPYDKENQYDAKPVRKRTSRMFYTARKPMPAPVSSDDFLHPPVLDDADELGFVARKVSNSTSYNAPSRDENSNAVGSIRRAFKAMVNPRTVSRRVSRAS